MLNKNNYREVVASGSAYGKTLKIINQTKSAMSMQFGQAILNPTFSMLMDRLYIYSAPNTTEMNEYGKPINDKWTLHRIISEI
mmetsp:Transcript_1986/g.2239  ORF Transcript_1986/g.2239 Transcript_1986/m.2239 type:complete len:83 (-) Transcript_1986:163-411(-)